MRASELIVDKRTPAYKDAERKALFALKKARYVDQEAAGIIASAKVYLKRTTKNRGVRQVCISIQDPKVTPRLFAVGYGKKNFKEALFTAHTKTKQRIIHA